jgi:glycosyltransferase involved in cell wall biosynthesis
MVIVLDDPTPADRRRLEALLSARAYGNVRLVIPDRKLSLGALRNVSIEAARGDVICLWDDDDLHHPKRMEQQVTALVGAAAGALFLADCLHLFMDDGLCYWVNWGKTRLRGLPGTLVARRDRELRYPEEGRRAEAGEDTDLLERLVRTVPTVFLPGPPFLYVYRFHGTNTWARDHHLTLARQYCEPRSRLVAEQTALRQLFGDIDVGLSETNMADRDGLVYSVRGARSACDSWVPPSAGPAGAKE